MCELQGEGNVIVYIEVCVRYRVIELLPWNLICLWGTYCENIIVYSDIILKYSVWEMLQCYVSDVQSEGNNTFYNDVILNYWLMQFYSVQWCDCELQSLELLLCTLMFCVSYRVRKMIQCTVICVCGTGWWKYYYEHWCLSELQGEGNVTVYNVVCVKYRLREFYCVH